MSAARGVRPKPGSKTKASGPQGYHCTPLGVALASRRGELRREQRQGHQAGPNGIRNSFAGFSKKTDAPGSRGLLARLPDRGGQLASAIDFALKG